MKELIKALRTVEMEAIREIKPQPSPSIAKGLEESCCAIRPAGLAISCCPIACVAEERESRKSLDSRIRAF